MSIASEIQRLNTAKAGIKSALEAKGVSVDSATTLDGYPQLVESIPSGGDDELVKGLIDGSLTALTVPNYVTSLKNNLFQSNSNIKVVNLHTGVTSLGGSCFNGASNLTAITVASGVTSFGNECFRSCGNLTTIDGLGTLGNIGESFMRDCGKLETPIVISGTSVGSYAFQKCYKIPSYTFIGPYVGIGGSQYQTGDTYSIFQSNTGCSYWDFTNCYIVPTTNSKRHFNGCTGEFRIPAIMANSFLSTKTPLDENNYFYDTPMSGNVVTVANKYPSTTIHYTSTVNTMLSPTDKNKGDYAAQGFGIVENIYDATTGGTLVFYGPSALTPNVFYFTKDKASLQTFEATGITSLGISASTFYGCNNMTDVILPNVTVLPEKCFAFNYLLTGITLGNVTSVGNQAFLDCRSLTGITLDYLQTLGSNVFSGCTGFTSFSSSGLTSIPSYAFSGITSLTTVNTPSVTGIGREAFSGCTGLSTFDFSSVETIGVSSFRNCKSLTSVTAPNLLTVEAEAFRDCSSLQSFNASAVTTFGTYVFQQCTSLTSIDISSIQTIGSGAFQQTPITEVNAPNARTIGNNAFYGCGSITSVTLTDAETIGGEAFRFGYGLTTVSLPSITSLGSSAFRNCTGLTSVTLGENINSLGEYVFSDGSVQEITFLGNTPPSGVNIFTFSSMPSSGVIYCPSEAVGAYTTWKNNRDGIRNWTVQAIS